jgi:hypothetical protein
MNVNDVQRFVSQTTGLDDAGVEASIRSSLNLRDDEKLNREHHDQYFNSFVKADPQALAVWDTIQQAPTSGIDSWLRGGTLFDSTPAAEAPVPAPAPAPAAPAAPAPAPTPAPMTTVPTPADRMVTVPAAPAGGDGLVQIQVSYPKSIETMGIIDQSKLPRAAVVDQATWAGLKQAPNLVFPAGPSHPVEGGLPLSQGQYTITFVPSTPASIAKLVQGQPQLYHPQWAVQSISAAHRDMQKMHSMMKRMQLSKTKGKHGAKKGDKKKKKKKKKDSSSDSCSDSDSDEEQKESTTEAKAGTHRARAIRHTSSRAALDDVLRAHKTIY